MGLDGSNGELVNGPMSTDLTVNEEETVIIDSSFTVPLDPKGLFRHIVKVYHEGTLVLTHEEIFCPPDMEVLE